MAMKDFFYDCEKLETRTVSDGLGGYEKVFYRGIVFKGLAVRKSGSEQIVGALRGEEKDQYTFHTAKTFPIAKDDVVAFTEPGSNEERYIRITSNEIINTRESKQTDWTSYDAETFTPNKAILRGV